MTICASSFGASIESLPTATLISVLNSDAAEMSETAEIDGAQNITTPFLFASAKRRGRDSDFVTENEVTVSKGKAHFR